MFGKVAKPNTKIDSLIGAGTTIEGNVTFTGGLRVDGEIRGNVTASGENQGTMVVSENARIEGAIDVPHLVINGVVTGPVRSSVSVELQPRARVTGDLEYNSVEIHLGAIVEGRLVHMGSAAGKAVELKLASVR